MKFLILSLFLTFIFSNLEAQTPLLLTGTVKDKAGNSIPYAGVYISGYKLATVADKDGNFKFTTLTAGNYDILIESVGYLPGKQSVSLDKTPLNILITLEEKTLKINEVVIRPDKNRLYYIQLFKENFIGKSPNSEKCKILNPEVLNIDYNKEDRILTVTTDKFLEIENQALGYKVKYLLQSFIYNYKEQTVFYEGYPTFDDLPGSTSKKRKWNTARATAYSGSIQHFYRSLLQNSLEKDGFVVHKMGYIDNTDRLPDSVINQNIKALTKNNTTFNLSVNSNDSLPYFLKMKKKPTKLAVLDRAVVQSDTLVHKYDNDLNYMNFTDDLYIIYTKEKESTQYNNSGFWISRPLDIPDYQISKIRPLKLPIFFYNTGDMYDTTSVLYEGYWAYEKIADQVPINYIPKISK